MTTPAEIIHAAAAELMGDYGKGTHEDVIRLAHDRIYGPLPPVVSGFSTVEEYAADVELIAGLVEARHYRTGDEWPAEYAATLMVATFGPPPTPDAPPDAPPDAYTCEWCPDDAADTADGFAYDSADPSGPWVPTCAECRHHKDEGVPR